jgi:hypothetical protein
VRWENGETNALTSTKLENPGEKGYSLIIPNHDIFDDNFMGKVEPVRFG